MISLPKPITSLFPEALKVMNNLFFYLITFIYFTYPN